MRLLADCGILRDILDFSQRPEAVRCVCDVSKLGEVVCRELGKVRPSKRDMTWP
jgi:hypothetical protein